MIDKKFQGQVAIISGGGRGIGKAVAEQLASLGAAVVLTARSEAQIADVAASLREQGAKAIAVPGDVGAPEQIDEIIGATLKEFGRIDILINNAAVIGPIQEVAKTDLNEWAYNIQVNLVAPFYFTRKLLPIMLEQKYGRIVNVSSGAAINPIVGASAYSASKAGLDMFSRAVAYELADSGVTVNSMHPGMVDTEMQVGLRSVDTRDSRLDFTRFHNAYEEGQLRSPVDVARAITWLAGPWSEDHNGEIFKIADDEWIRQVNADLGESQNHL